MKLRIWNMLSALLLVWCVLRAAHGEEVAITAFSSAGQLQFSTVPNATIYHVQWASHPNGPWTNSWEALANIAPPAQPQHVTVSVPMFYRVIADVPELIALPGGTFDMGDSLDGTANAPVHSVTLSAFTIGRHSVSKALWDEVRNWGLANGYSDLPAIITKGPQYPVYGLSWFDAVKWCNARSEKELLPPCYTVSGVPLRTGTTEPICHFDRTGYRLPTEAEWEFAARGGLLGKRFPWGDTITHAQANYFSSGPPLYDISPTAGYHPTWDVDPTPYSAPVGSFPANGYGLYDMAGNQRGWCWDWYDANYYTVSPALNPTGPSTSSGFRVNRGSGWGNTAASSRVFARNSFAPSTNPTSVGLRVVRTAEP